jgi:hypothetical protein
MSKMSDSDCILLLNVCKEWSLIVDLEVKYSMLVRELEASGIDL